jgi:hypothetical protein
MFSKLLATTALLGFSNAKGLEDLSPKDIEGL